jgi:hypothetical protein
MAVIDHCHEWDHRNFLICDALSAAKIDRLLRKWLQRLPHPFSGKNHRASYRYQISILQIELSLTQVLDVLGSARHTVSHVVDKRRMLAKHLLEFVRLRRVCHIEDGQRRLVLLGL